MNERDRLVVCGWDQRLAPLLEALRTHAGLEAVAVGDRLPAALVRARAATGLACYQHVLEMLRVVPARAALVHSDRGAGEYARVAAEHGADLLLSGDLADAASLRAAASAARRHGVALAVLRPMLRSAAASFLTGLAATDSGWRPRFAEVEVSADAPALHQARSAVALAARLMPAPPVQVVASPLGDEADSAEVIAAQLRYVGGDLLTITAHRAEAAMLRVRGDAPAGRFEAASDGSTSTVALMRSGAAREETELRDEDLLVAEAHHVAAARRGDGADARHAPAEAATLQALEHSLDTGGVAAVEGPGPRAMLRLLDGGASERTPRRGALHLVSG